MLLMSDDAGDGDGSAGGEDYLFSTGHLWKGVGQSDADPMIIDCMKKQQNRILADQDIRQYRASMWLVFFLKEEIPPRSIDLIIGF